MKVNKIKNKTVFGDLKPGDVFSASGWGRNAYLVNSDYKAVNLETGQTVFILNNETVKHYQNANLNLE